MPVIQLFRGEAAPGMANLDAIGTKKLDDRHSPFEEFAVRVGPSFVAAKAARQKVIGAIAQNLPGQQCAKAWTQLPQG